MGAAPARSRPLCALPPTARRAGPATATTCARSRSVPSEARQCPDGSVIPVAQICPRLLPNGTKECSDGSVIPVAQICPRPIEVRYPGPFIVFFDWDRDEITPAAAAILDNAAAGYQQVGSASVGLAGHADRSGPDAYNVGLSQRRADAVRAYLAGRGVPDAAITSEALGESRPLVDSADGVREPQNRRVELIFGPAAGW